MPTRAHVVLPEELIKEVDEIAGKRKRSQFVEAAIREKLRRDRLGRTLQNSAGILKLEDYPEWQTPEGVSAWVRASRRMDEEHTKRKLARLEELRGELRDE